jgi:uncharacterized repeat protein (TIGR01451 family)
MNIFALKTLLVRAVLPAFFLVIGSLTAGLASAQTILATGSSTGAAPFNSLYSVSPVTGAATPLCNLGLSFSSAALGVSNVDGFAYYFQQTAAGAAPQLNRINPTTCVNGTAVATNLTVGAIIRATFCPDGRFYAMSNTANFYEVNPITGQIIRTLIWGVGLPAGGSGDFACASNGDMYIVANNPLGTAAYNLHLATSAAFAAVPDGSTVAVGNVGDLGLGAAVVPNGITLAPAGTTGCAAAPNPCLIVSTGTTNQTWGVNSITGAATNIGTTGATTVDYSSSYPVDVAMSKSVTPTVALQGQTVVYTLRVQNQGPGVVSNVTVTDVLSPGIASAVWNCSVANAGSLTAITTSCGPVPSGVGSINNTVSLSINSSLIYTITAVLNSAFSGTLTNVGGANIPVLLTDPNPANNASTVTSTVTPATNLTILKTDGTLNVVSGQTTNYTITIANLGPGNAPNSVVKDPSAAGLNCTAATCTVTAGTATCPAGTPAALMTALQSAGGVAIPTFNAGSTVSFVVTCGVTATGQ